jgi:mannitol/fructose-specific phosphotransferase system IIA component (Ntr-type)
LTNNFKAGACFSGVVSYGARTVSSPTEFIAEPDAVMLDLQAASGEAAVRILHERLVSVSSGILDAPQFLADVIARMQLGPVCIADDIALPHARTGAVSRLVLAVARAAQPIAFDPQHPAVRLIFLIGTPQDAATQYLQAVSVLSRMLRKPATRTGLYSAVQEGEFRALLSGGVAAAR